MIISILTIWYDFCSFTKLNKTLINLNRLLKGHQKSINNKISQNQSVSNTKLQLINPFSMNQKLKINPLVFKCKLLYICRGNYRQLIKHFQCKVFNLFINFNAVNFLRLVQKAKFSIIKFFLHFLISFLFLKSTF